MNALRSEWSEVKGEAERRSTCSGAAGDKVISVIVPLQCASTSSSNGKFPAGAGLDNNANGLVLVNRWTNTHYS